MHSRIYFEKGIKNIVKSNVMAAFVCQLKEMHFDKWWDVPILFRPAGTKMSIFKTRGGPILHIPVDFVPSKVWAFIEPRLVMIATLYHEYRTVLHSMNERLFLMRRRLHLLFAFSDPDADPQEVIDACSVLEKFTGVEESFKIRPMHPSRFPFSYPPSVETTDEVDYHDILMDRDTKYKGSDTKTFDEIIDRDQQIVNVEREGGSSMLNPFDPEEFREKDPDSGPQEENSDSKEIQLDSRTSALPHPPFSLETLFSDSRYLLSYLKIIFIDNRPKPPLPWQSSTNVSDPSVVSDSSEKSLTGENRRPEVKIDFDKKKGRLFVPLHFAIEDLEAFFDLYYEDIVDFQSAQMDVIALQAELVKHLESVKLKQLRTTVELEEDIFLSREALANALEVLQKMSDFNLHSISIVLTAARGGRFWFDQTTDCLFFPVDPSFEGLSFFISTLVEDS